MSENTLESDRELLLDIYKFATQAGKFAVWSYDIQTDQLSWDTSMFLLYEIDESSFSANFEAWHSRLHPEDYQRAITEARAAIENRSDFYSVFRIITPNSKIKFIEAHGTVIFDADNKPFKFLGLNKDISDQKLLENKREKYHELLIKALELSGVGGWEYDVVKDKLTWTKLTYQIHDLPFDYQIDVESAINFYAIQDRPKIKTAVENAIDKATGWDLELQIITAKNRLIWVRAIGETELEGDKVVRLVGTFQDITESINTTKKLHYLAERDPLTGTFNRAYFQEYLNTTVAEAKRKSSRFALLFLDLDEFKSINDTFGHIVGDDVLKRTVNEILAQTRKDETLSRLGGDEFALIASNISDDNVIKLAERIIHSISHIPFILEGNQYQLTTSIGIAYYPDHGDTAEELIANADLAMYSSKMKGKNIATVFDSSGTQSTDGIKLLSLNQKITYALDNEKFHLDFQGIYDTNNLELHYAEALVRMYDLEDKLIMPGEFIPAAENSGAIIKIDHWVTLQCIKLLKENFLKAISVNLSARTIAEGSLVDIVLENLQHANIEPSRLIFEITETSSITNINDANKFFTKLQDIGCRISLDDFGSGFASFTYLKFLHIDTLKIDGEFIVNLASSHENQVFVKSMVEIAGSLNIDCVAEYVEDIETLQVLRRLGVQYAQGYLFGKPSSTLKAPTISLN